MAAAAAAASLVLFPTHRPALEALLQKQLGLFPADSNAAAMASGSAWAEAHLAHRADDGASRVVTYVPVNLPGRWRRTPARMRPPELPHWAQLRPFSLTSGSQFRCGPPPALVSPEYAEGWLRTRDYGRALQSKRTPEETLIAKFWSCFSYTVTPAGHWCEILHSVVRDRQMPLASAIRAFALLSMATADAAIAAWDVKYTYEFWRPVHAIPLAEQDGNPLTEPEPGWMPLLETPPHPEYISGHSIFAQAGVEVLRSVLERDDIAFQCRSDTVAGAERPFTSLQASADEMITSRVLGGIHFTFSTAAGQLMGREVAKWTIDWMNQRVPV